MGVVKYTGPMASFHAPTNAEIRSLKVHFSPKQEGSGDPSPENVRPIEGWGGIEQYYSRKNIGHVVGYSAASTTSPSGTRILNGSYGNTISTIEPENSVIITQTQWPESSNLSHYKNGYFAIVFDNLTFNQYYDFSFKITNITNNPLNASISDIRIGAPSGTRTTPTIVNNEILIFKNLPYKPHLFALLRNEIDVYVCGMSFTLSDIMVTPANMNDGIYESYTQNRIVKWNQWLPALNDENWQAYNSNYINTTFENGVATSTWLTNNSGYQASLRTKTGILQKNKEIWYLSYMLKTSMSGGSWGAEFNGGLQNTSVVGLEADVWTRCSECSIYWRGTRNYTYISYYRAGIDEHTGMVAQVKSPIFINLTQMFGAGNEPSKEEFEEQCALNGIDLTSTLPYDEGSIKEWKTNGALLKNSIIFPVLGKNKFNINASFAEPSDTSSSSSVARIFQSYTYCLGLSASNSYLPDRIIDFSISNNTLTFSTINTSYGVGFAIPLQPGSYRMTYTGENVTRTLVCYNNEGNTVATNIDSQGIFYINPKVSIAVIIFRSSTANTPTTVSNVQIEEGVTATEYEEFNPNHTVYGGWVDLITGEVQEEWNKIDLGTKTWTYGSADINFYTTSPSDAFEVSRFSNNAEPFKCNIYKSSGSFVGDKIITINNRQTGTSAVIRIRDTSYDDASVFKSSLDGALLYYKMNTSITYHLAPIQLQTFLGQNNVWSNADYVEVEYDLHETQNILARKQLIIANQPHTIKPAAAPLQEFVTNLAAPLKECKVYFNPIQDLHGYEKPWIGGSGKNLLNISANNKIGSTNFISTVTESKTGFNIGNSNVNGGYWVKVKPNTTYTYSYTSTYNGGSMHARVWPLAEKTDNWSTVSAISDFLVNKTSWTDSETFTTNENTNWIVVGVYAYGAGLNSSLTNIQIEEGSTATSYEPYGNICPISGHNEIQLGLPEQYTHVEYIGAENATPYIDTGIYLTDELQAEIYYYNDKSEAFLFGARKSTSSQFCNFNIDSNGKDSRFDYLDKKMSNASNCFTGFHNGEFLFTFKNRIGTLTDCNTNSSIIRNDYQPSIFKSYTDYSILLFAVNTGGTPSLGSTNNSLKIYSAKFWIGSQLVRNFIPCVRKSDNVAGMYDTVTKVFFTSQNSDVFTSGEEIQEHKASINWLNTAGTLYGGYVDLKTGEIWKTIEMVSGRWGDIKTGNPNSITGYDTGVLTVNNRIKVLHSVNDYGVSTISNVFNKTMWSSVDRTPEHYYADNTNNIGKIYLYSNYDDDVEVQVTVELETPQLVGTFTPIKIKTLRGNNNIWSSANENIELTYWSY